MNIRKVILAGAPIMTLAAPAYAQYMPQQSYGWNSTQLGNFTFHNGTGAASGWSGTTNQIGNFGFSNFNGPNGQHRNCTSNAIGTTVFTNCN